MATRLSKLKENTDWKQFRRVARYYERELRRIRDATALPADHLRSIAGAALFDSRKR